MVRRGSPVRVRQRAWPDRFASRSLGVGDGWWPRGAGRATTTRRVGLGRVGLRVGAHVALNRRHARGMVADRDLRVRPGATESELYPGEVVLLAGRLQRGALEP